MQTNLDPSTVLDFEDDVKEYSSIAKWKNPPALLDLKRDLISAQPDHDNHILKVNTWLDNLNITGSAKIDNGKKRSAIVPKLIRKQAEWRYAALTEPFLSTSDIFNTDPVTFEDKKAAIQNGLILNDQFNNKINKIAFIDEYVRTAVDEGTVIVRTGWDFREETYKITVPDFQYQTTQDILEIQKLQRLSQLQQEDPITFKETTSAEDIQALQLSMQNGIPIVAVQVNEHEEQQTKTIKNCPTVEICNFNDIIIDPTCLGDLSKAGFVIYKFLSDRSTLLKDGKYTNVDKIQVDSSSILSQPDYHKEMISFNFKDNPRQKFYVYEYWGFWDVDGEGEVKPIVVTWVGNTIIRMEENPFPHKSLPFVKVQYLPVRKRNYGEPDGELLVDNQKIIGAVTRGMIDIMGRSANSQQGTRKDALDAVNKRKFDQGLDYEFNPQVDPKQAFYMHTFPEIPQSAQYMINMQNMEAESITGVKSFSQGVSGNSLGDVAVGVRGALDAASKRELGILRRLAEGIIQIGRHFVSMNSEWLSEEEVIRITNDEFITIRRDDLAGNIDIKLSISTAEADDQKAQELAFMLQTMGNSMPQDFSQILLADIARLRKMPDLAKKIEKYVPQPDPIQQQMQQLQMELLQAQIATEKAKAMEYQGNAMLDQAKAQTEQVKAKQNDALADKTNLDFVEQESGIAHQRAIETAQAQAQGNIALEQVKHNNALEKGFLDHSLNLHNKALDQQENMTHKMLDHASAMEQIKAKPKGIK